MTCSSCGYGNKNKTQKFPGAVVEINNPGSTILLRKVVIPASLGDDESVPPVIGKYRNVILTYEANKHTYIYSSDGIPTLIEAAIPPELYKLIPVITMTDTDPGEGVPLEENHFIAVYE